MFPGQSGTQPSFKSLRATGRPHFLPVCRVRTSLRQDPCKQLQLPYRLGIFRNRQKRDAAEYSYRYASHNFQRRKSSFPTMLLLFKRAGNHREKHQGGFRYGITGTT